MRILVIIMAALLLAGGSGWYMLQEMRGPAAPVEAAAMPEPPQQTEVFAPAVELAAGAIILPEHLSRIAVQPASVTPDMVVADEAGQLAILGSVARQMLPRGVPIARNAIVQPGDRGFLAAVLNPGMRAISIPISETAGLSGLVLPGDRVDIILTYSISGDVLDAQRDIRASETVLTNLRVLALDQRLNATEPSGATASAVAAPPPVARTATLEVTPQEAEMITLATTLGELSLVLNSVSDGGAPQEGEPAIVAAPRRALTLDSEVTSLLRRELALMGELAPSPTPAADIPTGQTLTPLPERITRVQVVRGITSNALEFGNAEPETAEGGAGEVATSIAAATEATASIAVASGAALDTPAQ